MTTRFLKSRIQTPVWWIANMGYRFYSHHLKDFYNCDWIIDQLEPQKPALSTRCKLRRSRAFHRR